MKSIGIIGMGNLGKHLSRLIHKNDLDHFLKVSHGPYYQDSDDNDTIISGSDIIFLTVKPKDLPEVCKEINQHSQCSPKIIVSMASGVSTEKIYTWLDHDHSVIRCATDITISAGYGNMFWYDPTPNMIARRHLMKISAGTLCRWVDDEDVLDLATVISSCSPAYISKFYQSYINASINLGLSEDESKILLSRCFRGTLLLLDNNNSDTIINEVATENGVTQAGLKHLEENAFEELITESLIFSYENIKDVKD